MAFQQILFLMLAMVHFEDPHTHTFLRTFSREDQEEEVILKQTEPEMVENLQKDEQQLTSCDNI
jgi:hypothetical protein